MRRLIFYVLLFCPALALSACGGGAVVFAPTPPPPDLSPLMYTHPSGAFSLVLPRMWSVYALNTASLASAAFTPPGEDDAALRVAVVRLAVAPDSTAFAGLMDRYQSSISAVRERYTEQNRQAMGDGSWRITGVRQTVSGGTQRLNTFIQRSGALLAVLDVLVPENDPARFNDLQAAVNTLRLNPDSALTPADPAALAFAVSGSVDVVRVSTWTTPQGVFFVTGEIANFSSVTLSQIPVRVVLFTADGLAVKDAADVTMGLGLPPGAFAPFSLRFGEGQPALTTAYRVEVGSRQPLDGLVGVEALSWTDASSFTAEGQLVIEGMITHRGAQRLDVVRAVVTVFDAGQNVIAASFTDVGALDAGASVSYRMVIPDRGGVPANYIVSVQGLAAGAP